MALYIVYDNNYYIYDNRLANAWCNIYINRTRTSTPNALMECGGFGTCDRTTGIHINRWIELYQNQI